MPGSPRSPESRECCSLRLILYDFDCTLSTLHLYHTLNEEAPEALVEGAATQEDMCSLQHATMERCFGSAAALEGVFGGAERLQQLKAFLEELRRCGVMLGVLSHGFTSIVSTALRRADLLSVFDQRCVIGADHPLALRYDCHKFRVVAALREQLGEVPSDATLLIDDDVRNLLPCKATRCCGTLWIWRRRGMDDDDFERVRGAAQSRPTDEPSGFTVASTLLLHPDAAAVGDGYFRLQGYSDLAAALAAANDVPPHRRIEGVFVVPADDGASYAACATARDAARFEELLRSEGLPAPRSLPKAVKQQLLRHGSPTNCSDDLACASSPSSVETTRLSGCGGVSLRLPSVLGTPALRTGSGSAKDLASAKAAATAAGVFIGGQMVPPRLGAITAAAADALLRTRSMAVDCVARGHRACTALCAAAAGISRPDALTGDPADRRLSVWAVQTGLAGRHPEMQVTLGAALPQDGQR
eukprot:TRINITY_DN39553_c0_g1_i1.p1 TRINITY_DN39553_c0_g1~~TRINITY_DN39553_c0_g1_i1.p1  ORF type:complete len:472 (+),score=123.52 TRINITY_DN39553_c0_g1_i1:83-1498(+)